nr:MAG TPA: hypothetical protein [Caudoviricetes sp.]
MLKAISQLVGISGRNQMLFCIRTPNFFSKYE